MTSNGTYVTPNINPEAVLTVQGTGKENIIIPLLSLFTKKKSRDTLSIFI